MKIETELFKGTPLDQDTYELRDPESQQEWKSAYSGWWISAWDFPSNSVTVFDKPNMWLHEFCHVMEVWIRRDRTRLLTRNYGFEFGRMTRFGFRVEAWVLSLQSMLSKEMFGTEPLTDDVLEKILIEFTKPEIGCDVTMAEFKGMLMEFNAEHERRGPAFYYNAWQEACAYVKENRTPDFASMLGM
jgi:hypothetical protein